MKYKLLIHSAKQVVQVVNNGDRVLCGTAMKQLAILRELGDDGVSVVVDIDGKINTIGYDSQIKLMPDADFENIIDASGKCIIPGLVDGHTHAIWAGDRVHEFAMKLAGATYMEVHKQGGGINFTVDHVHKASEDELYKNLCHNTKQMLNSGTTLMECKSGYGLTAESEIKMLRVMERARNDPHFIMDLSPTYCGAHSIPKVMTSDEATEDVLTMQLPQISRLIDQGELHVDNIDVFCEQGVYSVEQTRKILQAGKDLGMQINFHGEELHRLESPQMGADLGAHAISHLEEVSPEGIQAMVDSGIIGVVLPTTAYVLRLKPPPVRQMIDSGMAVALGSDLNPNAHCLAMPMVMNLACVTMHMTMAESMVAATINAAASVGKSHLYGSLEVGKMADMVILDAPRWEHIIYQMGSHDHIISHVFKGGELVKAASKGDDP